MIGSILNSSSIGLGVDVNVYAYGNYPKSKFQTGNMNNIDVGNIVIDSFQFRNSMNDISEELRYVLVDLLLLGFFIEFL
jgi:hypothetical protein